MRIKQGLNPKAGRCPRHKDQSFGKFSCVLLNEFSLMCCTNCEVTASSISSFTITTYDVHIVASDKKM